MDSEHSNYKDFVWAIGLCRFGFKIIGLWPEKHEKNKFLADIHVTVIFIIIFFVNLIPLICSLVQNWGDMILMVDNLCITLSGAIVVAKFVILRWKQSAVSFIVKKIAEDWMHLRTDAERDVMIKRAQIARFIIICGYIALFFAYIARVVIPSFNSYFKVLTNHTAGAKVLPFPGYYFYDTDKSPQFECTLIAQTISAFFVCVTYMSVDTFFTLIIFHVCGQLENFRYQLFNLVSGDNFTNVLRYYVQTHLRLIRFADNIEQTFSMLMLILLLYFSIAFCLFSCVFVATISDEASKSFSQMAFLTTCAIIILLHTFFYCGSGQLMERQFEAVYRDLCDLEWHKWEPRESRTLILLMIRAGEPFHLTAGKIFPLSMATFCSVLKTSLGYISFLLAKHFVWAIGLCRFNLKMLGLWPINHETNKNIFVSYIHATVVFIIIFFAHVIPLARSLVRTWGNMIFMIEDLQIFLTMIATCAKFFVMQCQQSAISLMVHKIAEDWMHLKRDAERNVMIKQAKTARLIVIYGNIMVIFGFCVTVILPFFGLHFRVLTNFTAGAKVLPFSGYYFYDTDKSPQFEFTFAAQAISITVAAIIYTSIDAFFALIIFHICGQLENFRYRLHYLVPGDNFTNVLRFYVQTHLRLIRFADDIEHVFNTLMLILLCYFSLTFCLVSCTLVTATSGTNISLSRLSFLITCAIALLSYTFTYCGGGHLLERECEAIYHALCNLEWYKWEPKESRTLILLMIRASEPFHLTAGKLFPLSMATFCSVVKSSIGYISFLLAKNN